MLECGEPPEIVVPLTNQWILTLADWGVGCKNKLRAVKNVLYPGEENK